MNIIYDLDIICKKENRGHVHAMLRKTYESNLIPSAGMLFEDSAWREPREPLTITCNFEEGYYLLRFDVIEMPDRGSAEQEEKMYRSHGWRKPGEDQ